MTHVLFCSPYLQQPGIVTGGINVWGKNIINYHKSVDSEIALNPISFDRIFDVQENTSAITRIIYGIKDYKSSIGKAIARIKEGGIDVMHLCTSAQLSLFKDLYLLNKAKKLGVKTVVHFHFGRIPELLAKKNWEGKMILKVCSAANSVAVMDLASYHALKKAGFSNVYYLPNPLSVEIMNQISGLEGKIERQSNKLLYVGHVIPTKGVYELVEACSRLSNIELHMIGTCDDKTKQDLIEIAQKQDEGKWLHMRGGIPHEEVISEMLSSGVYILPSYTEGFPNVILESMAASCAIVATNVGAIPEMLNFRTKDICGIEIAPKDVDGIMCNLKELVKQQDTQEALGRRAKHKVYKDYSMPSVWNQLQDIWVNTAKQ